MVTFDPKKHLIKVQGGRLYLPVAARLIWFRQEHPDWGIETEISAFDPEKKFAVFRAKIYDGDGKLMAVGTKMEDVRGFADFVEKAETGAVGRALALCGYGTQFAPDFDETPARRYSDAPMSASEVNSDRPIPAQSSENDGHRTEITKHHQSASRDETTNGELPGSIGNGVADRHSDVFECSVCSKPLNKSQVELSTRNYGAPLCPTCQKGKARSV